MRLSAYLRVLFPFVLVRSGDTPLQAMLDVTGRVIEGDKNEVFFPVVVRASARNTRNQFMSTEMLHWDEYRAQRSINDGSPVMSTVFRNGDAAAASGDVTFVVKDRTYSTEKIVVASPSLAGAARQSLCAEMIHWDDLRLARGLMAPGEQPIAAQFKPVSQSRKYTLYNKDKGSFVSAVAKNAALAKCGDTFPRYCTEMEHYDDYCKLRGIVQQNTMQKLFAAQ